MPAPTGKGLQIRIVQQFHKINRVWPIAGQNGGADSNQMENESEGGVEFFYIEMGKGTPR
jgi:hypothetical protein